MPVIIHCTLANQPTENDILNAVAKAIEAHVIKHHHLALLFTLGPQDSGLHYFNLTLNLLLLLPEPVKIIIHNAPENNPTIADVRRWLTHEINGKKNLVELRATNSEIEVEIPDAFDKWKNDLQTAFKNSINEIEKSDSNHNVKDIDNTFTAIIDQHKFNSTLTDAQQLFIDYCQAQFYIEIARIFKTQDNFILADALLDKADNFSQKYQQPGSLWQLIFCTTQINRMFISIKLKKYDAAIKISENLHEKSSKLYGEKYWYSLYVQYCGNIARRSGHIDILTETENWYGKNHVKTIKALRAEADFSYQSKNYDKAKNLYIKILEIFKVKKIENEYYLDTKYYLDKLTELAISYQDNNTLDEALISYQDMLDIYESIQAGNEVLKNQILNDSVTVHNKMGKIYMSQKNDAKAFEHYGNALDIVKEHFYATHLHARTFMNLAHYYCDLKKDFIIAQKYCDESLKIIRRIPNYRPLDLATIQSNTCHIYYSWADSLLNIICNTLNQQNITPERINLLKEKLLLATTNVEFARTNLHEAIPIYKQFDGENSKNTSTLISNLNAADQLLDNLHKEFEEISKLSIQLAVDQAKHCNNNDSNSATRAQILNNPSYPATETKKRKSESNDNNNNNINKNYRYS
ncbi:MAG: hypothetical protein WC748_05385 [Legionellales bacterium]|jgi:tetratricopeptide (TPR) repeat protein